jgi:hypothetical protein
VGESAAIPLLEDIVVRRPGIQIRGLESTVNGVATVAANTYHDKSEILPAHPLEREKWVEQRVREYIARVLMMDDIDDIGLRTRLSDLGLDSVMTMALRQAF